MKESTIYRLLKERKSYCKKIGMDCLREMLFGDTGLGARLERQGGADYGAVPSPTVRKPVGCNSPDIEGDVDEYFRET